MRVETRKVIRIAKYSAAVVLPPAALKALGVGPGDSVFIQVDEEHGRVILTPVPPPPS